MPLIQPSSPSIQSSLSTYIRSTDSNKRPRNNTITSVFSKNTATRLAIEFLLENNLSFATISSKSFIALLNYHKE